MNKKNIDKLIPQAMQELQSFSKNGVIDKKNQGYLASFGPTVISSGILQTVMFYTADKDKNKMIKIMFTLIKDDLQGNYTSMQEMLNDNSNYKDYSIKNKILEANIACKLAIRTFELKEE